MEPFHQFPFAHKLPFLCSLYWSLFRYRSRRCLQGRCCELSNVLVALEASLYCCLDMCTSHVAFPGVLVPISVKPFSNPSNVSVPSFILEIFHLVVSDRGNDRCTKYNVTGRLLPVFGMAFLSAAKRAVDRLAGTAHNPSSFATQPQLRHQLEPPPAMFRGQALQATRPCDPWKKSPWFRRLGHAVTS